MGSRLDVSGLAPPGSCPARSRHRPRPAPDRVPPVRPQKRLGRRPARRRRGERLPGVPLLGRVRRMAPRPHRGGGGGDEGPLRLRVRRFPPRPPLRADRLRLPRGRVAPQGRGAGGARPAAAARPHERRAGRSRAAATGPAGAVAAADRISRAPARRRWLSAEPAGVRVRERSTDPHPDRWSATGGVSAVRSATRAVTATSRPASRSLTCGSAAWSRPKGLAVHAHRRDVWSGEVDHVVAGWHVGP